METSINLRINAGQAKSEAESVRQSVENLAESLEKLKGEGDWGGAAEAIRKQQEAQGASLQQQTGGYPAGGAASAGYAGAGSTAQALKSLEMRIETLTRVSEDLAQQLEKAAEGGDAQSSFNLSTTLNNVEQERRQLIAEKTRLENPQKDNKEKGGLESALKAFNINQLLGYAVSASGIYSSYRQSMARGDYIGAEVGARSAVGSSLMGAGGAAAGLGALAGVPLVGTIAAVILGIAGGYQKIKSDRLATQNAEADAFMSQFNPASMVTRGFINNYSEKDPDDPEGKRWIPNRDENPDRYTERHGGRHVVPYKGELPEYLAERHGYFDNNEAAKRLMTAAQEKVQGLEIDIPQLLQMAKEQAVYGAASQEAALSQASKAARFAQSTGTDAGTAASYIGLVSRFGAGGIEDATRLQRQSGMREAQSDEFLTGLQRVIEEGIANGYVRSSKDVGQTLSMFYRLANNEDKALWQGKYGAANLSKLNAGVAGATALSSSSDVMAFGAAQNALDKMLEGMSEEKREEWKKKNGYTGTYTDTMRILEKGVDVDLFYAIMDEIEKMEGGNVAAIEERIRQVFGVNYTQAGQIREMSQNRWTQDENGNWVKKTEEELKNEFNSKNGEVTIFNNSALAINDEKNKIAAAEAIKGEDSMRDVLENLAKKADDAAESLEKNAETWIDKLDKLIEKIEGFTETVGGFFNKIDGLFGGSTEIIDDAREATQTALHGDEAIRTEKIRLAYVDAVDNNNGFIGKRLKAIKNARTEEGAEKQIKGLESELDADRFVNDSYRDLAAFLSLPEAQEILSSNPELEAALNFRDGETFDFGLYSALRDSESIQSTHEKAHNNSEGIRETKKHSYIDFSKFIEELSRLSQQSMAEIRQMLGVVTVEESGG